MVILRIASTLFLSAVIQPSSFALQAGSATASSPARTLANNEPTYVKLRNIKVGGEAVHVKDFTFKRDAGVFTFHGGVFYFLEPVNGKVTGAVFTGDANFALKPPLGVEQRNLAILTKGQPFDEQFSSAVFRFTDGSEEEIRKAAVADTSSAGGDASGLLSEVQDQLKRTLRENLTARLLEDVLSSPRGGKFVAFIKGRKYSPKMIYDIDPHGVSTYDPDPPTQGPRLIRLQGRMSWGPEEIALSTWDDKHYGIWAAFHYSKEYAAGTANSDEQNGAFTVSHQKLDVAIDKSGFLTATAQTTIVAQQEGVRVLGFNLFPTLRVDSITGPEGQALPFIQEDQQEDADLAIILPRELKKGEGSTLTVTYRGRDAIIDEGGGNYYPAGNARDSWYPGLGFNHYSTYEMSFRIPKGLKMAASGKLIRDIDEGSENLTQWSAETPQPGASFNFGKFKKEEGKPFKQPYILETYANPEPPDFAKAIQHLGDEFEASGKGHAIGLASVGTFDTLGMMKKAMGEAQLSVEIYTDFFGEAPYKRLAMTQQTAGYYGESFPSLVYLPITYFYDSTTRHRLNLDDARGYFKVVGPHEVAHQWWGNLVGCNAYRDAWLSEGFADMSASLFLQYVYTQRGLDEYHKFWADQRWLMTLKNLEGKRAIDVGPLTIGPRLDTAKSGFDISRRLIYPKGSYTLQMVRFMLRNEQAGGDPDLRFKTLMHEFTKTYANRPASTEDFKAMLEKYMTPEMDIDQNHKMDWFFNQFVYGTEYPSYRFEHNFTKDANGDVVLNFKLSQSDVSDSFAMLIPIYMDMGGKVVRLGSARLIGNNSVEQHVPLKGLKDPPKRAMAAYYDDILGNVENK